MNKLLIIGIVSAVAMFVVAMLTPAIQFAGVFFGVCQALLNCAIFYVVDRFGFRKIDTIKRLETSDALYAVYMCIYAVLILAGFYMSYGLFA